MQALKVWEYDDIFNPVTDLNENFSKMRLKKPAEAIQHVSKHLKHRTVTRHSQQPRRP